MSSTLISTAIANLTTGVSQQPPALRLPTACNEMINAWPSVVSGLSKRPPTKFIAKLTATIPADCIGYIIDRDSSYRYLVTIFNGDLKVFDLNGVEQTVSFPDGKAYLSASSYLDNFKFVTVGDTTFVLNREKVVSATANYEPASPTRIDPTSRVTFYVTNSVPNSNYNIYVNGSLKATFLTGKNVDAATALESTVAIATDLASDLTSAGYSVTQSGSVLSVSGIPANADIVTNSSNGDKVLRWYRDEVTSFSDLPPTEVEYRVLRIKGDVKEAADDYYVQYVDGIWRETVAYGKKAGLNNSTMPHILVRNADGTWTFRRQTWYERLAGDDNSNLHPSFVGYKIRDIFLNSNRLGLIAEENVIMSEVNEYENFYRTTLTTLLDSDPIDFAVLHNNVNILQHAVAYNNNILLLSDQNQFRMTYDGYLGPKTVKTQYSSSFNCSRRVTPLNIGGSAFFVDDLSDSAYARLMEYYPKENQTGDDADDITAAVPEYVTGATKWIAGSASVKAIFMSDGSSTIFTYKWYWAGDRKVQNAWGKWTFDDCTNILWGGIVQEKLVLLIKRSDGVSIESISLKEDVFTSNTDYTPLLDRYVTLSAGAISYNSTTGLTTLTLPYSTPLTVDVIASEAGSSATTLKNIQYPATRTSSTTVTVAANLSGQTVIVGYPYTMLYEFSPFYIREAKGNGEIVILDGRLQLRYLILEYHDTFYFKTEVSAAGRETSVMEFTGQTLGSEAASLGNLSFPSGTFRVPIMGQNVDTTVTLKNDSPYPCYFGSGEVLAQYYPKAAKRV